MDEGRLSRSGLAGWRAAPSGTNQATPPCDQLTHPLHLDPRPPWAGWRCIHGFIVLADIYSGSTEYRGRKIRSSRMKETRAKDTVPSCPMFIQQCTTNEPTMTSWELTLLTCGFPGDALPPADDSPGLTPIILLSVALPPPLNHRVRSQPLLIRGKMDRACITMSRQNLVSPNQSETASLRPSRQDDAHVTSSGRRGLSCDAALIDHSTVHFV